MMIPPGSPSHVNTPTDKKHRFRFTRKKAFVILIAVGLAGLVALEAAARLRAPKLSAVVSHPILNHCWRPNFTRHISHWEHLGVKPYVHHYNTQSWIDEDDIAREKPADTLRIFYLGDSFIEGSCPMDRNLPSLVEAALNRKFVSRGLTAQVINTGTTSYGPIQYYLLLKTSLLDYDPDLVVINLDMSDVYDDFLYRRTAVYDDNGKLVSCSSNYHRSQRTTDAKPVASGPQEGTFKRLIYDALAIDTRCAATRGH